MKKINWTEIYGKQAPLLKGVCRRYVKDLYVAEDMVHNAFEMAIQKIDTFKGLGSFEGWLRRIAINQCLQYLREKQMVDQRLNEYEKNLLRGMMVDEVRREYSTIYSQEELLEVIDGLPDQHKLVFNLYVMDGYKHHEIAEMLNISTGTSKSNLSRARKKAQELLMQKAGASARINHRRHAWVLLLFSRFKLVDTIFRSGLKGYSIGSHSIPIIASISNPVSMPLIATLSGKLVIGISAAAFISGTVVLSNKIASSNEEPISNEIEQYNQSSEVKLSADTLELIPEQKIPEPKLQPVLEKVVVRKQKIIRDTIYVHKTSNP